MEPIKFDDHIREQLQEREIQPSNLAWEKLNKELNRPSKKPIRTPWYAIAASIVGLLVIASLVFRNQTNSKIETDKIVKTKVNTINDDVQKESIFKIENNKSVPTNKTQNQHEIVSETPVNLESQNTNNIQTKKAVIASQNSEQNILDSKNQESIVFSTGDINTSENDFLELKVAEVVAKVVAIKKSNKEISEDEINTLLEKAQFEIQSQRILVNNKVDATALLNSVETELETTFREKVFDALGERFEKVRTAVVERDN